MITYDAIMAVSTAIVTFIFAELSKKFKLVQNDYIPLQNLTIGFIAGLFVWLTGLNDNVWVSFALCILGAFGAGGFYDLSKTGSDDK